MGLFQQKPEEQKSEWKLPAEPLERDATDLLGDEPPFDPLGLNLSTGSLVASVEVPVTVVPLYDEPGADGD